MIIFDRCVCKVDGALLSMNQKGTLTLEGNPQAVETIALELAGFSPVPKKSKLTLTNAQPPSGFEFDYVDSFGQTKQHTISLEFLGSGLRYQFVGVTLDPKVDFGAASITTSDWSFEGTISKWE